MADGFADVARRRAAARTAGVNNFRVFVQGNGPDLAPAVGDGNSAGNAERRAEARYADRLLRALGIGGERRRDSLCDIGRDAGRIGKNPSADAGRDPVL